MLCSQWPVARVSFFTEGTQYQAIWLRMNKNVICVRSTSRARAVLFSSCVIKFQLIQETDQKMFLWDLLVSLPTLTRHLHQTITFYSSD